MSCPSGIYAINNAGTTVAAGGIEPLVTTVRRYGSAVRLVGNGVEIRQPGYYLVDVFATVQPNAAGVVSINLLNNGTQVPGAYISATASANQDAVPLAFTVFVRQKCCDDIGNLTISVSKAGTVANAGMVVTKQ